MTTTCAMQLGLFTGQPVPGEVAVVVMDRPAPRPVNEHSRAAREHHAEDHRGRKELILECVQSFGRPMTDRQIKDQVMGGAADMNTVRPRVNDLLREHRLIVAHEVEDHVTGEMVRTVWVA